MAWDIDLKGKVLGEKFFLTKKFFKEKELKCDTPTPSSHYALSTQPHPTPSGTSPNMQSPLKFA